MSEHRRERALTVLVVLEFIELFVVAPLTAMHSVPLAVEIVLAAAILGVVLIVVQKSRAAVVAVLVATAVEVVATVLRLVKPSERTEALDFAAALTFLVALTVVLAIVVLGGGRVTIHRIQGAIAIYLNVALAFALVYRLIAALASPSFTFAGRPAPSEGIYDFVYFSFETLTTIGYGDILPVHPFARSLSNLESLIGQLFPATVLARLITLELESRRDEQA